MDASTLDCASPAALDRPSLVDLVASARRFAPMLRERARRTEQERMVSAEVIASCRDAGFFRILQPKKFGGLERNFSDFVQLAIELGRADGSTAWAVSIAILHNWLVGLYPLAAQREVWSDPDNLVTGSYAPNGKVEVVEGAIGSRANGRSPAIATTRSGSWSPPFFRKAIPQVRPLPPGSSSPEARAQSRTPGTRWV